MRKRGCGAAPLCLAVLCGAAGWTEAAAAPKIVLSQEKWSIGEIWHMDVPKMTLIIRNEGDAELVLTKVHASCGCTAATPKSYNIPPEGQTEVEVSFNSQGKQGHVTSSVTVLSNDPARPEVKMDIDVTVKRAVNIEPLGGVVIRSLDPQGPHTGKATIRNNEAEDMKLELVGGRAPDFDVELKEVEKGRVWEVSATTRRPLPFGRTVGTIELSTGLKREPKITVSISAVIIERVELSPPAIYLMPGMIEKPTTRQVTVQYYGADEQFKVTGWKSSSDLVNCSVNPTQPTPSYLMALNPHPSRVVNIVVNLPASKDLPRGGVYVEFTTSDPEFEKMILLVTNDNSEFQRVLHKGEKPIPPAKK